VLHIDKGRQTARPLRLGNNLQCNGRLARGFRAKDFRNAPTPRAASKLMDPVEITAMGSSASLDPSRTMDPLPNCFSICARAISTALLRSSAMAIGRAPYFVRPAHSLFSSEESTRRLELDFDGIVAGLKRH